MKRAPRKAKLFAMPSPAPKTAPEALGDSDTGIYLENIAEVQKQTDTICRMIDNGDLPPEKVAEVSLGFLRLAQVALCGIMARMQSLDSAEAGQQR